MNTFLGSYINRQGNMLRMANTGVFVLSGISVMSPHFFSPYYKEHIIYIIKVSQKHFYIKFENKLNGQHNLLSRRKCAHFIPIILASSLLYLAYSKNCRALAPVQRPSCSPTLFLVVRPQGGGSPQGGRCRHWIWWFLLIGESTKPKAGCLTRYYTCWSRCQEEYAGRRRFPYRSTECL